MSNKTPITVRVRDFTTIPGPRFKSSGDNSAEQFFIEYVLPVLKKNGEPLIIDFSGTWGYGPSFTSQLGIYIVDILGRGAIDMVRSEATDDPEVVERFTKQMQEYIDEKF